MLQREGRCQWQGNLPLIVLQDHTDGPFPGRIVRLTSKAKNRSGQADVGGVALKLAAETDGIDLMKLRSAIGPSHVDITSHFSGSFGVRLRIKEERKDENLFSSFNRVTPVKVRDYLR